MYASWNIDYNQLSITSNNTHIIPARDLIPKYKALRNYSPGTSLTVCPISPRRRRVGPARKLPTLGRHVTRFLAREISTQREKHDGRAPPAPDDFLSWGSLGFNRLAINRVKGSLMGPRKKKKCGGPIWTEWKSEVLKPKQLQRPREVQWTSWEEEKKRLKRRRQSERSGASASGRDHRGCVKCRIILRRWLSCFLLAGEEAADGHPQAVYY